LVRFLLTLLAAGLAANVSGATVNFQVGNLGGGNFRYTYSLGGFSFAANDTLDISFNAAVYNTLFNGVAQPSSDWSLLVFQPNALPGLAGDYFLTASVNNPSLAGPFSVDFTLKPGAQPGSQAFTIFDPNFNTITSGQTTPVGTGMGTPEPASFSLAMVGMLIAGVMWFTRRRTSAAPITWQRIYAKR